MSLITQITTQISVKYIISGVALSVLAIISFIITHKINTWLSGKSIKITARLLIDFLSCILLIIQCSKYIRMPYIIRSISAKSSAGYVKCPMSNENSGNMTNITAVVMVSNIISER